MLGMYFERQVWKAKHVVQYTSRLQTWIKPLFGRIRATWVQYCMSPAFFQAARWAPIILIREDEQGKVIGLKELCHSI